MTPIKRLFITGVVLCVCILCIFRFKDLSLQVVVTSRDKLSKSPGSQIRQLDEKLPSAMTQALVKPTGNAGDSHYYDVWNSTDCNDFILICQPLRCDLVLYWMYWWLSISFLSSQDCRNIDFVEVMLKFQYKYYLFVFIIYTYCGLNISITTIQFIKWNRNQ